MKKFFIFNLLAIVSVTAALACGGWVRPNYYMYHICNDVNAAPGYGQVLKFWSDYTGKEIASWDVSSLSWVNLDEWAESDNEIVKSVREKNDYEAELYVKRLVMYLQSCASVSTDGWEYPDEQDIADFNTTMSNLRTQALGYKGTRFASQYALLVMRTNMAQHRYAENITYWNQKASKMAASACGDLIRGIYANALYSTGRLDEAAEIYADLRDSESLQWMARKMRNFNGIKKEYNRNPNSALLTFLVEDFVNNAQETFDSDGNKDWIEEIGRKVVYRQDINNFISFATGIAKDKKSADGAMWLSAAGMLNYLTGKKDLAVEQLTQSLALNGTQAMKDNARRCLILARAAGASTVDAELDAWLAGELQWLESRFDVDSHSQTAMSRIANDALLPLLKNNTNRVIALKGYLGRRDIDNWAYEYYRSIDDASSSELAQYFDFVKSPRHSALERFLTEGETLMDADQFNDMIGTKLLREGEFAKAIPYLEKVPLSYLSEQSISRYAARRDYNVERWFEHQTVDYWDNYDEWYQTAAVKSNQKVQYCKDVIATRNLLGLTSNSQVACEAAYKLANLYFQASHEGDCWYLANYSWSVNDEVLSSQFDFIGEAIKLLRQASRSSSLALRQKATYALAYLPIDLCWSYDWESNWRLDSREGFNYDALTALAKVRREAGGNAPQYMTNCDVLNCFMAYNR